MWRPTVAVLVAALAAASGALAEGEEVLVAPGTLATWRGEGIDRCGMAGSKWNPLDGACWYAIDLLTPAGSLEVGRWRGGRLETRRVRVADYPYPVQHIRLADDSRVDLSAADLARVGRESTLIGRLWSLGGPARFRLPLAPPLERLPAGGRFGARRFFNGQPRSPHSGADYAADSGTPVLAAADGEVALTGEFFFSGHSVFLHHGDGLVTMYFHLSRIEVEKGARVQRGEAIGRVGQSGRATGPHLHFAARWRGARIDPARLMNPGGAVEVR
jgi:murein DD-endopeptidase MepM/ murein hydrolase activator NlpD